MEETPKLATGVWVGFQERYGHLPGDGSRMALPIWVRYMKKVYADKALKISQNDFEKPKDLDIKIELDCSKYNEDKEQGESIEFGEDF